LQLIYEAPASASIVDGIEKIQADRKEKHGSAISLLSIFICKNVYFLRCLTLNTLLNTKGLANSALRSASSTGHAQTIISFPRSQIHRDRRRGIGQFFLSALINIL